MTVSPGALIAHYGSDGQAGTEEHVTVVCIKRQAAGTSKEQQKKTGLFLTLLAVNNKVTPLLLFASTVSVLLTPGARAHYLCSNQSESQQIFP